MLTKRKARPFGRGYHKSKEVSAGRIGYSDSVDTFVLEHGRKNSPFIMRPVLSLQKTAPENSSTVIGGENRVRLKISEGTSDIDAGYTAVELRRQEGVDNLLGFVAPELHAGLNTIDGPGELRYESTWTLDTVIYICKELLPETTPGFQAVLEHEKGHIKKSVEALAGNYEDVFGGLISILSHSEPSRDTREAARTAIRDCMEKARVLLDNEMKAWDDEDYPRLHARLRELGVSIP